MTIVSSIFMLAAIFLYVTFSTAAVKGDSGQYPLQESADPGLGVNPNAEGATAVVTPTTGPNGGEDWLNTGFKGNGWDPPFLDWNSLLKVNRKTFYSKTGKNCEQYDWAFQASGDRNGIDPVFLAFIAMQESSCDANAGGPTPGLMQVACSNYPDGKCTKDVAKNVEAGTKYLRQQLDESNNNALKAIGNYNGWFTANDGTGLNGGKGLTETYPCSQEGKSNGQPQNLDYLHQTLNGWFVGLNPYGDESWIGGYRCQGSCDEGGLC